MAGPSPLIEPSDLAMSGYAHDYPTPPPMSDDGKESSLPPTDQPPKKKRKAWGQPVPEIKQILPPRKRAKTAEEKEQRKNERILRNRRAADKSRQRQKAAVADLEVRQGRIEQEVHILRDLVARYQTRFGVQEDFPAPLPVDPSETLLAPSPAGLESSPAYTPAPFDNDEPEQTQPTFVESDHASPLQHASPVLAPQLNLLYKPSEPEQSSSDLMASLNDFNPVSDLTQYPAVVLCDLQCQPETWATSLPAVPSLPLMHNLGISYLLQIFQILTVWHSSSMTTLYPICQLFRILANRLSTSSSEEDFSSILSNFPLIHSLISMPSTPTRPAVFRMKLLSRLLACSPHMARLLLAATDRALQQVVAEDGFAEDPERRWTWSSLMTIKWTILRLEREHRKIRRQVTDRGEQGALELKVMKGVDLGAVARNAQFWANGASSNCNTSVVNSNSSWTTVQAVH